MVSPAFAAGFGGAGAATADSVPTGGSGKGSAKTLEITLGTVDGRPDTRVRRRQRDGADRVCIRTVAAHRTVVVAQVVRAGIRNPKKVAVLMRSTGVARCLPSAVRMKSGASTDQRDRVLYDAWVAMTRYQSAGTLDRTARYSALCAGALVLALWCPPVLAQAR